MEIEFDKIPPYNALIEDRRIFHRVYDAFPESVCQDISKQENQGLCAACNQLTELREEIHSGTDKVLEFVVASKGHDEKTKANSKRKRIGGRLLTVENEPVCMLNEYSNGEKVPEILCRNVSGTVNIYNLDTGGFGKDNLFVIHFPRENVVVIGDKSKVKKDNLMDAFIRAGIMFESSSSRSCIAEALYNFFAPRIEFTKDVWDFPTYHGWRGNVFFDANNPPYIKRREFEGFPVYEKYFSYVKPTNEKFQSYFEQLSRIRNCRMRALILMLPFYGIISSLLAENVNLSSIVANFVMLNEKEPRKICELVQVFNRNEIGLNSLDISDKEMDEIIKSANDEVVLLDAICEEEDTKYYKDKITNNALYCTNVFLGKRSCKNKKKVGGHAVLAIFSTQKIIVSGCVNIIVTEDFLKRNKNNDEMNQSMEAVLTAFIEFVKMNCLEVKQIIRKQREEKDGRERLLAVMQEILTKFFQTEGFAMLESAKFSPNFNFNEILVEVVDTEELLDNFRMCVKKSISKFYIVQKGKILGKNNIYYDSKLLYFPTHVFDRLIGFEGMFPYKEEILLKLYEQRYLRKDIEGFSRKLMISGVRFETYQIQRDFFDVPGEVSIIDLGKEPEYEG